MQVLATDPAGIVAEAERLRGELGDDLYVKIPITEAGLHAIGILKGRGVNVTATALYSKAQGLLAIAAGADYIAPYFNRMESLDIDISATITSLARFIERQGKKRTRTKVMAASFKNVAQMSAAFDAGADAATIQPALLRAAISTPDITNAVRQFSADWYETFGTASLP